jgi:hypothetical protein
MGISGGPKLPNMNNLLFTKQPGETTTFDTNVNTSFASDVATPSRGAVVGPRRTLNIGYGPAYDDSSNYGLGPIMEVKNIPGSIYTINTSTTSIYTISLWIKIVSFPTHYDSTKAAVLGNTLTTKSKRSGLARFNFSNSSDINKRGWIEFGAMAPYYLNASNNKNYKSIFSPISFGAAISGFKRMYSFYTDYKFNPNQWYLVTFQIESSSNFSILNNQTFTAKIFVNNTQENIAQYAGKAWSQPSRQNTAKTATMIPRRKRGAVAGQPGFYNVGTGGTVSNSSSQSVMLKVFPDLTKLNYISYSPNQQFYTNNGSESPSNFALGRSTTDYQKGSGANFGQTYIYNTAFNSNIYTQFKTLYN